jgi:hypothetical protein
MCSRPVLVAMFEVVVKAAVFTDEFSNDWRPLDVSSPTSCLSEGEFT